MNGAVLWISLGSKGALFELRPPFPVPLPYFSTQPDTGRPHMQNTVSTMHSYV